MQTDDIMESNELQSVLDLHAEELKNAKEKNQSIFHNLSTSDTFPESVVLDHNYAKAWNLHPEADHVRPAKILFMKGVLFNPIENIKGEEEIDVETLDTKLLPTYDMPRAKNGMKECERFCNLNQDDSDLENWEEQISKVTWSIGQKSLFDKVLKTLYSERLALLANKYNSNEPVLRRLAVDKMASRFRSIFGSVSWDMPLLHWLHQILCDNLPQIYLAQYLDILQTLKSKAPSLVDKMLSGSKNVDSLQHLLKRPWDPISSYLNQNKVKRLPKNPLIVWTPGDPAYSCVGLSRRMKFWHTQFSNLGKLITVNPQVNPGVTIGESLEAIITAVRYEVMELKLNFPSRPIILVGWTIGALIACQVALFEPINAIVCLGFPLTGVNGSRGDLDDPLLENRTPTLFVVGQKASMCSIDDIEDFRERMRAESGLVVIGGADDHLRVCRLKKQLEGINQNIVDRCIVDEMYNFLSTVLSQPPVNYSDIIIDKVKFEAPKRKRKSSSMIDPPFPDPTIKKPRAKKNSGFPFVSFSGNVSPSSPGSSTTETSSTTSSTCETFMEKVFKTNGRSAKPQISNSSLLNLEEMKRKKLMVPPNGNGSSFTPIDLPPPEKEDKASFFSQQLGLPVISPSLASTAASSLVTTAVMNPTSTVPRIVFSSQNSKVPFTTLPQMVQPTFTNSCMTTNSNSAGSGRLVVPKGNSPPGLSLNIGSLSSLSSFRQTMGNTNPTKVAAIAPSNPKLMGVTRNIRPKSQNQLLPASSANNPLYGKRLLPSTTTSSIILTPRVVSNSQPTSNLSFLTMTNPMLSNILGSSLDAIPTLKNTLTPANQSSFDIPSLPAPLNLSKTSESDRIRTYMKAPQRTTSVVKTTTYVKGSPNMPKQDLPNMVPAVSVDKLSPLSGNSFASSIKTISNASGTTTITKSNGARKLQVITFLKPPPISNSGNKEVKTTALPKTIVSQTPNTTTCKLSSPENASGALRLISSAIRVAEQKNCGNSGTMEISSEPSQKISLAQLSSDFQSEYLRSVCKPSPAVQEEINVPKVQNVEGEPSASITPIVINDAESVDSGAEVKVVEEVTSNETEMAVQSLMMEPITTDSAPITFVTSSTGVVDSAITDRLSHLSAGTQEAILALTQLSELA